MIIKTHHPLAQFCVVCFWGVNLFSIL